jgi:alkylation response protein AidB-like acyl-CoA dehydrogenase
MSMSSQTSTGLGPHELFEDEHKDYRESFAMFLQRRVTPAYGAWRDAGRIPRELLRAAAEDGFMGMAVPVEYGGLGIEDQRFGVVLGEEAMRAGAPALALALAQHNDVAIPALLRDATEATQAEWLPRLGSGEALAAIACGDLRSRDDGDQVILDGVARLVVSGDDADVLLVSANSSEPGTDEASDRLALVATGCDGLRVERCEYPIGLQAAGLADVHFDGVRGVALGGGAGAAAALGVDHHLSLAITAQAGARAALALTVEYVLDRKVFGQPLAGFQNTRRTLAGLSADLDAAGAFVTHCVRARLAGQLDQRIAASVKLHCTELYGEVVDAGVQLHGGYGYMMEYPIAHAYADARFWRLHGDTSQASSDMIASLLFN